MADETGRDVSDGPPPILVTAQRRVERNADVPLSVATLPGQYLAHQRIQDIAALVAEVPGFTLARSLRGPPILTLRGMGFNSLNMSATSPVGIYVDEMAMAYPVMSEGLLFDLERVEVVKGPQGTLFGRNTTAGLVNAVTVRPQQQAGGFLTFSGGSYAGHGAQGAFGGALAGALSARFAFSLDRTGKGWQQSITREDRLGRKDRMAARLSLRWEPPGGSDWLLTGNWWQDRSDTPAPQAAEPYPQGLVALGLAPADWPAGLTLFGLPADFLAQSFPPAGAAQANWAATQLPWGGSTGGRNFTPAPLGFARHNDFRAIALQGNVPLHGATQLQLRASHAVFRRNEVTDNSGWAYENIISRGLGRIESLSGEARIAGKHGALDWVIGAIHSVDRVRDVDQTWAGTMSVLQGLRAVAAQYALASGADAAAVEDALYGFRDYQNSTTQTARSLAVYGQAAYRPGAVGLTAGLRYTRDLTRFAGCSRDLGDGSLAATMNAFYRGSGIPSDIAPGGCITFLGDLGAAAASGGTVPFPAQGLFEDRLAEENLSGRLAVDWRPAPGTMVYASAARGFKAGTFPNIEGNVATQYAPARQEEVWSLETGIKAQPARWLDLDAAVFWSDYRNKQALGSIPDIVFGSLLRVLNMPRSHVYGMEASARLRPARQTTLEASLSLLRTRVDRFEGLDDFGQMRDFAGASFLYAPRQQWTVRAAQGFALPAGWTGQAGLSARYSSRQQADLTGDPRFAIRPYHLVDGSLALRSPQGRYDLDLFVKNLTNAYYWHAVHLAADSFARFAAMPRTWGASITRRF